MAEIATVLTPLVRIEYEGKDVSRDLAPMLLSASYTDHDEGQSDQVEIQLENSAGRWNRTWRPKGGERVKLLLGYVGGRMMDQWRAATVDEIEYAGPPDTVTIRALVTGITQALRTAHTDSYEGLTLRQIAKKLADLHGLSIYGAGPGLDIPLARVSQQEETDIAFLRRLAGQWGLGLAIKEDRLIFQVPDEQQPPVLTLTPQQVTRYSIQERLTKAVQAAEVAYHDPDQGDPADAAHQSAALGDAGPKPDVLKLNVRVENQAQADAVADAALAEVNKDRFRLWLTLPGEPRLLAGLTVGLSGWGTLDGTYYIETARHQVTRSRGYETSVEARLGATFKPRRGGVR
jgi:hypothetical protein